MNTEERLANLERELANVKRRNRRLILLALVGAGAALVAAAWIGTPGKVLAETGAKAPNVVRANEFILEDAKGKTRATLVAAKDGPALRLLDENGNVRATLTALKEGPGLCLFDENGKFRATLGALKDGPGLCLFDQNGKGRAVLGAGTRTMPGGRVMTYPESSLFLFGPDGKAIWSAP
jgi:hypothetical protein